MAVNWIQKLLGRAPEEKAAALPFVGGWRPTPWNAPTFRRLAEEGYSRNGAVFACISALAIAYAEAPPVVLDAATGAMLPDHPAAKLLARPNPLMSWAELDTISITYRAIGGSCYLHKVRSRAGRVVELWPYHAGQVAPVPSADGWVSGYEYTGDGDLPDRAIPAADVVHLKWPSIDPIRPWLPLPPLVAVAREVDTDTEIGRYLFALLSNDATPPTVIKIPPGASLSQVQFDRLRQSWEKRHGRENRGRVAVLEGGADIARMSLSLDEMAWEALRMVPEARIAAAFRVPAIIAGLGVGLDRATYANFAEARKVLTQDTIVPFWRNEGDELTQSLADEFGGRIRFGRDLSRVAALQESSDSVYQRALTAWDAGLITRNEARTMLGLVRVEELEVQPGATLPPGDTFTAAAMPLALPEPAALAQRQARIALTSKALKADSTGRIERRLARAVQAYLAEEYARAAERVEAQA